MAEFRQAINSENADNYISTTREQVINNGVDDHINGTGEIGDYGNVFLDNDDGGDFEESMSRAMTSAELARLLGTQRTVPSTRKRKSGPAKKSVKIKVYYLPDASKLPSKFLASDPLLKLHMQQGYGKNIFLQFAYTFFSL